MGTEISSCCVSTSSPQKNPVSIADIYNQSQILSSSDDVGDSDSNNSSDDLFSRQIYELISSENGLLVVGLSTDSTPITQSLEQTGT